MEAGKNFAEREALLRCLTWRVWAIGFGPAELLAGLSRSKDPGHSIRVAATVGTPRIGSPVPGGQNLYGSDLMEAQLEFPIYDPAPEGAATSGSISPRNSGRSIR